MRFAWKYTKRMATMVQIRNMPDDLHRKLKARAAMEGLSLSDYLLREVRNVAERPTLQEMMERLSKRAPVRLRPSPATVIRAMRGKP
jgi:plasmid stability protein